MGNQENLESLASGSANYPQKGYTPTTLPPLQKWGARAKGAFWGLTSFVAVTSFLNRIDHYQNEFTLLANENSEALPDDPNLAGKKLRSIETKLALVKEECEAFHVVKAYGMPLEVLAVMYAVQKVSLATDTAHMEPYRTGLLVWSSLMMTDVVYHGIQKLVRSRLELRNPF